MQGALGRAGCPWEWVYVRARVSPHACASRSSAAVPSEPERLPSGARPGTARSCPGRGQSCRSGHDAGGEGGPRHRSRFRGRCDNLCKGGPEPCGYSPVSAASPGSAHAAVRGAAAGREGAWGAPAKPGCSESFFTFCRRAASAAPRLSPGHRRPAGQRRVTSGADEQRLPVRTRRGGVRGSGAPRQRPPPPPVLGAALPLSAHAAVRGAVYKYGCVCARVCKRTHVRTRIYTYAHV